MKKILICILAILFVFPALAEEVEEPEYNTLFVMSKTLNGRIRPGKKYQVLETFVLGQEVKPTGRMNRTHEWIEIETVENQYVWCNVNFLTERKEIIHVYSLNDQKIKIRKYPGYGKVTGYAKKNQIIEITQVVMGYGKCSKGWVDLKYFIEDYE